MEQNTVDLVAASPLFCGVPQKTVEQVLHTCGCTEFPKDTVIFSRDVNPRTLGILVSGTAQVEKGSESHRVVMSRLSAGEVFGAVSLYGDSERYVTRITAVERCNAVLIPKTLMDGLIRGNPDIAVRYITYLSNRIYFLNSRIDAFTGGSAAQRVARYLSGAQMDGALVHMQLSLTNLSQALDIGRASLYRALGELEAAGAICRVGKEVQIISDKKLQGFL